MFKFHNIPLLSQSQLVSEHQFQLFLPSPIKLTKHSASFLVSRDSKPQYIDNN